MSVDTIEEFRQFVEKRHFKISSIEKQLNLSLHTIGNCVRRYVRPTGESFGMVGQEELVYDHFRKYYGFQSIKQIEKPIEPFDLENFRVYIEQRRFNIQGIEKELGLNNGHIIAQAVSRKPRLKSGELIGLGRNFFTVINHFIDVYKFDNSIDYRDFDSKGRA